MMEAHAIKLPVRRPCGRRRRRALSSVRNCLPWLSGDRERHYKRFRVRIAVCAKTLWKVERKKID
jgi:hypothetical protein